MEVISTDNAALPIAHYVQGIKVPPDKSLVFCSGQLPIGIDGKLREPGNAKISTAVALQNALAIVEAAGGTKEDIVFVAVLLQTKEFFVEANAGYAQFFGQHKPARAMFAPGGIPKGADVEVIVIAAV